MELTLTIPDDLATQLEPWDDQALQILELGLREWNARGTAAYEGTRDVLETLAGLPSPEEILALRPSARLQERVTDLLKKNRSDGLSPEEEQEWRQYEFVEHLMRVAKAKAQQRMNLTGNVHEPDVHPA